MLSLHRILVPIDDTPLSDRALDLALSLAERFEAHLYILFVRNGAIHASLTELDEADLQAEEASVRETVLARLREGHHLPREKIHPEVRTGGPEAVILAAARELGVDAIVMGTHGRHGVTEHLVGSTTERVMARTRASVFAVRDTTEASPPA